MTVFKPRYKGGSTSYFRLHTSDFRYSGDISGFSVSSAGDINGDGFDDLLIGAANADPNGQFDAGESYVVFGGSQFAISQPNRPPIIEDQTFTLNENSPNNTVVGSLVASDPDNNTFTYSLVGTNSAFAINPNTGQIIVTDSTLLDFETNSRFSLRFKVTDSGNLSDIATITIKLNDLPVLSSTENVNSLHSRNLTVVNVLYNKK